MMKINKTASVSLLLALFPFSSYSQELVSIKQLTATAAGAGLPAAPAASLPGRVQAPEPARLSASKDMGLAELAAQLSNEPGTIDKLVETIAGKSGYLAAWATPERKAALAKALKEADKETLDHFPTLTPKELFATAAAYASKQPQIKEAPIPPTQTLLLSGFPKAPRPDEFLKPVGYGLLYGDESQPAGAAAYGDSIALAQALDRLANNAPEAPVFTLLYAGKSFNTVSAFLGALRAEGVSIEVQDRRYFANFGDLRYEKNGVRREVRTPLYVDTGLSLSGGRHLILPATHSELDIYLRGKVNADLSFFFGLDGLSTFRTNPTTNMSWVGGRTVETYSGARAVELLDRAGWFHRAMKAKAANLPQGGYGPLGDCNDVNAFVTGRPAYPMTRNPSLFRGGNGLDAVSNSLPYDLLALPKPAVIFDSLPFGSISDIPFPEVRQGLTELRGK